MLSLFIKHCIIHVHAQKRDTTILISHPQHTVALHVIFDHVEILSMMTSFFLNEQESDC